MVHPPEMPDAWVLSTRLETRGGKPVATADLGALCPKQGPPSDSQKSQGPQLDTARGVGDDMLRGCLGRYETVTVYQPANRFWRFQWLETVLCVVAGATLTALAVWGIDRVS